MLLQAAAQYLPPINITVQQPVGGMPDWAKIGIGAILAIVPALRSNTLSQQLRNGGR
jgi:hypothetical protein